MAQLSGSGSSTFFKFDRVGQVIKGRFVKADLARQSPWGPKVELTLDVEGQGTVSMTCPTVLANIIKENIENLRETQPMLTVTYTGNAPSNKGNPVKKFTVDAAE